VFVLVAAAKSAAPKTCVADEVKLMTGVPVLTVNTCITLTAGLNVPFPACDAVIFELPTPTRWISPPEVMVATNGLLLV
jgi:hypothetical protein